LKRDILDTVFKLKFGGFIFLNPKHVCSITEGAKEDERTEVLVQGGVVYYIVEAFESVCERLFERKPSCACGTDFQGDDT